MATYLNRPGRDTLYPLLGAVLCLCLVLAVFDEARSAGRAAPRRTKPTPHTLYLPAAGFVSSPFGLRLIPGRHSGSRGHKGMDISAPAGTTVVAAGAGTVTYAGERGSYGLMVEIDHGRGLITRYGHLHSRCVSRGDRVELGAMLGLVGQSGRTTGPNLHFETIANGRPVDPLRYIATDIPVARPRAFTPRPGLRPRPNR